MNFCTKCGKSIKDNINYCIYCGNVTSSINSEAINSQPSLVLPNYSPYPWEQKQKTNKWYFIVPLIILGVGAVNFSVWYFSTNENLNTDNKVITSDSNFIKKNTLKFQSTIIESNKNTNQEKITEPNNNNPNVIYTINSKKSYFFEQPSYETKRKGYLTNGDKFTVEKMEDNFAFGYYEAASSKITKGWIYLEDLRFNNSGAENTGFIGGETAWNNFISQELNNNLIYDVKDMPGYYFVMVSFNINTDSSISDVEVLNNNSEVLNREAIRTVSKSPSWKVAFNNGDAIRYNVRLPIKFFYSAE